MIDKVSEVQRSLRSRGALLLAAGALLGIWGSFWSFVFVAHWYGYPAEDVGIEIAALVAIGLAPMGAAAFLLQRWRRGADRLKSISELARAAWGSGEVNRDHLAAALSITPARAEELLVDAMEAGLLAPSHHAPPHHAPPHHTPPHHVPPHHPPATVAASGTRPASNDLVGQTIGHYFIESFLAAGGMGIVYIARHLRTGRRYAFKTMLHDTRITPDLRKRFEREAVSAGSLGHPGIVAVHDFNQMPSGAPYMVMDLLQGETLGQRLSRGAMAWSAEAKAIALKIGDALACAHDNGLMHRDLKPGNIFLRHDRQPVLLDFGLAKPIDATATRLTATGQAVGTPLYMSPEQARGEPIDVRSDVYSLAAVIYEMVTGSPPFMDRTLAKVYARLLGEVAPAPSSISPSCPKALDMVLDVALKKDRELRYATVRAFVQALHTVPERNENQQVAG